MERNRTTKLGIGVMLAALLVLSAVAPTAAATHDCSGDTYDETEDTDGDGTCDADDPDDDNDGAPDGCDPNPERQSDVDWLRCEAKETVDAHFLVVDP